MEYEPLDQKIISIDVYGDFACFTQADSKVERTTYPVITPSAARNILSAIYAKPVEFYYEIVGIDVMKPIRYELIRQNEVYQKATEKNLKEPIITGTGDGVSTQRYTQFLYDVYYRISFIIHKRTDTELLPHVTDDGIYNQFVKRLNSGKCFHQPYLGLKECMCFFKPADEDISPISESMDLGIMTYDVFDITNNIPLDTNKKAKASGKVCLSYYHPYMINGHINVPRWGSQEIFMMRNN